MSDKCPHCGLSDGDHTITCSNRPALHPSIGDRIVDYAMAEMAKDTRPFNIQGDYPEKACTVPWWLAEIAYEEYSKRYGTQQSLQDLHNRHGFSRVELVTLLRREEF